MNIQMKDRKSYFYVLFFIPLFFTPKGLYQSFVTENYLHLGDSGLVFPVYFFIGIISCLLLFMTLLIKGYLGLISREIKYNILIIGLMGLFISSIGVIIHSDISVYIRYTQMLTGVVGVFISWYLFEHKRLDIEVFFGRLGIMYFIIIIMNYIYSFTQVGIASFGRGLQPSIGLLDIYQTHVYYPFIINTILFMSLPYIMKKQRNFLYIYIGFYILYLLSWQVRGAILSFIVMLSITFFIKFKMIQKLNIIIFISLFLFFLIYYLNPEVVLGKFADLDGVKNLSGRTDIWISIFNEFKTIKLIFGNFYYDEDGITAHNQYLELLDMGGVLLLISFGLVLLNIFILLFKILKSKVIRSNNPNLVFYSLILLVHWMVDFNINVPMSNTNPSIFYWFFLNSIFVLYHLNKENTNKC